MLLQFMHWGNEYDLSIATEMPLISCILVETWFIFSLKIITLVYIFFFFFVRIVYIPTYYHFQFMKYNNRVIGSIVKTA